MITCETGNNVPLRYLVWLLLFFLPAPGYASSSIALGYTPKYATHFKHFDYVNPNAPKGGTITMPGFGNYDSFNPFTLKGVPAAGLTQLVFESLMVQSQDEAYSLYANLADDIQLAPNKLSVTFHLDPRARFSNGDPVLAKDVKFTFDTLKSDKAHPRYRLYWRDITRAVVVSKRTIRFDFARVNPELHLIIAQMQVFSPKWLGSTSFDKLDRTLPIGTGPYTVEKYQLGKDIVYKRNPNYWARNLPSQKGMYNFDHIVFKYYRDFTVMLEALKAGEYDFIAVNNSKQWARDYVGPQFDDGRIIKKEIHHKNNAGMQGFIFNIRRELFKDRRVRRAISLAFDFDWSNKKLFYNQYTRCDSYFSNSELASSGLPKGDELKLLNQYRDQLPADVFTQVWHPPRTNYPGALRKNLIKAQKLLNEAGWRVRDGVLQNANGKKFEFSVMLVQKGFERILAPFAYNLRKLGIIVHYRTVDVSLYEQRVRNFKFDMVVASFGESQSPGNEQFDYWSSRAADQKGSQNLIGIKNPVVDALINKVVFARNRKSLIIATHALDRVLLHGEYLIPNWYIATHRIAYWNKFSYPKKLPLYYQAESWALATWWKK